MTPKYRDLLLNALLAGARDADPLVRASAVSNLGDVCKHLRFSLGPCVHEVRAMVREIPSASCLALCSLKIRA